MDGVSEAPAEGSGTPPRGRLDRMPEDKSPDGPSLEPPPSGLRRGREQAGATASEEAPEVAPRTPVPDDPRRPGADETTPTRTVPTTGPESPEGPPEDR